MAHGFNIKLSRRTRLSREAEQVLDVCTKLVQVRSNAQEVRILDGLNADGRREKFQINY